MKKKRFWISALCIFLLSTPFYFFANALDKTPNTFTKLPLNELYAKIVKSTVAFEVSSSEGTSLGSGVIYKFDGEDAYIVTNSHVVNCTTTCSRKIITADYHAQDAQLIQEDEYADIAVVKTKKTAYMEVATIGNSYLTKPGEQIFAIGGPMSKELKFTLTDGFVSGVNRLAGNSVNPEYNLDKQTHAIQVDLAINPGNSGGGLFNAMGELIGINTMKLISNSLTSFIGLNFSIPIHDALVAISYLEKGKAFVRTSLGNNSYSNYYDLTEKEYAKYSINPNLNGGVFIHYVDSSSPLTNVRITNGTVITHINEKPILDCVQLRKVLYSYNPGTKIKITINQFENKEFVSKTYDVSLTGILLK